MNKVTQQDIEQMNILYLELKTYAAVARKTGFSAGTVKKYIIPNFHIVDAKSIHRFEGIVPNIDFDLFDAENWSNLCLLSDKEMEEIRDLWSEITV